MASEEANNSIRKPSARRSKPDMAALVDQQRFFGTPWSRNTLYHLDSFIPVVTLHDLGNNEVNIRHFSPPSSSHSEKRFHKHPPLSCSSSGDSDIGESNTTNSVTEVDEDDDLPLSAFLPLKSINSHSMLLNNSSDISINNNSSDNNLNNTSSSDISSDISSSSNDNHKINHSSSPSSSSSCQCRKPAVLDDPRWDGEYCSPECLIRVCHEAFQSWLKNQHCIKGEGGGGDSLGVK